ncbi:MAG: PilN domain-containing protein [Piscinibacter sp.]|uniref:PilN domain-containing protein n=1 Tax=Piscinibacter sp. TaxID=1903157 RepID=UPI001B511234|nr:PilN domain-containing protein [Piscinibacter sp.]MBP5991610.1 PilN domain-containing protein [Piscinibacter sp.]MBP6027110.1 PilN domain-containing protein [Piscinibacter sp.]
MILINLLPHREEKRQRRKIAFFAGLGAAAAAGLAIVGIWYLVVQQLTSAQQARNDFLNAEIKKLEVQIKDIATLRAEIESLKARQKAVEDLQIDRNVPVHLLNELVKQTPEGIYFKSIKQDGQSLMVSGIAQTQERISELLRNTNYSSEWLEKPDLVESKSATAQTANKEQRQLFEFAMRLQVKRPQEAASMPGGAASGPAGAASAPAVSTPNKA